MYEELRHWFRQTPLFDPYKTIAAPIEYFFWKLKGSPQPKMPHLVKQREIKEYARKFGLKVLIETGTNFGKMIQATKDAFREVYSIELDEWKYKLATKKFEGDPNVHLLKGDSAKELPKLMASISEPCLLWLDGHFWNYSTPVKDELECLYQRPEEHVLLIDDARWFIGENGYPTLAELTAEVERRYPGRIVEVRDDIIRIHKPRPAAG